MSNGRSLCIQAVTGSKLVLAAEVTEIIRYFDRPDAIQNAASELSTKLHRSVSAIEDCAMDLVRREILTPDSEQEELLQQTSRFSPAYGRDPGDLLNRFRRSYAEGPLTYWATGSPRYLQDFRANRPILRVSLLGACDAQMESDFLRAEGSRRGLEIKVAATFQHDLRVLADIPHDAVIVGALSSRSTIRMGSRTGEPLTEFLTEARSTIEKLRGMTDAPIIINNLPIPTVQPLGFADRGVEGHRNLFRRANLELESIAAEFIGVYIADIDEALSEEGKARLLDDGLVDFTHFGSQGWMLQRPESELAAVHGIFPDVAPLAHSVGGNPYWLEAVVSKTHADMLMTIFALDQKKCVITDLDGILWPGRIAETGSPFHWSPEVSGMFSFVGLYFGIHEALKSLQKRGLVLACVSKNDEATIKTLWSYESHYPRERLLSLPDFVTHRINWKDKVTNIISIAEELGYALNTFVFLDDNPVERERVRQFLPEVLVEGENLFGLRRWLLSDARLQPTVVTKESMTRTEMVQGQILRQQSLPSADEEAAFRESLKLEWSVSKLKPADPIERVKELFDRTTQFNTTDHKYQLSELAGILQVPDNALFIMNLRDRFGDQGVVGAAVVKAGTIEAFCLSCRALGFELEHRFLKAIVAEVGAGLSKIQARLVSTPRNLPARNFYKDNGFEATRDEMCWEIQLANEQPIIQRSDEGRS